MGCPTELQDARADAWAPGAAANADDDGSTSAATATAAVVDAKSKERLNAAVWLARVNTEERQAL